MFSLKQIEHPLFVWNIVVFSAEVIKQFSQWIWIRMFFSENMNSDVFFSCEHAYQQMYHQSPFLCSFWWSMNFYYWFFFTSSHIQDIFSFKMMNQYSEHLRGIHWSICLTFNDSLCQCLFLLSFSYLYWDLASPANMCQFLDKLQILKGSHCLLSNWTELLIYIVGTKLKTNRIAECR